MNAEVEAWTTAMRFECQGMTAIAQRREYKNPRSGWVIEFDGVYATLPPIFCTADDSPAMLVAEVFAIIVAYNEERDALLEPLRAADDRYQAALDALAERLHKVAVESGAHGR